MNRVFLTADTHFGHRKVTEFRPYATVEDHDRDLISRWNAVVRPQDTVWHLGDVYFREGHLALAQLNGIKKLVLGNHDTHPLDVYTGQFSRVFGAVEYRHCLLTHIPVHPCQLQRWRMNIHGHMHANKVGDPRYACVSLEHTGYAPILADRVIPTAPTTIQKQEP